MLLGEAIKHQFNRIFHLIISWACLDMQLYIKRSVNNIFSNTLLMLLSIIDLYLLQITKNLWISFLI